MAVFKVDEDFFNNRTGVEFDVVSYFLDLRDILRGEVLVSLLE